MDGIEGKIKEKEWRCWRKERREATNAPERRIREENEKERRENSGKKPHLEKVKERQG